MTGEAQGSEDSIKSFLKELNKGPSAAHVVKVEKEEIETKVCIFSRLLLSTTKSWKFLGMDSLFLSLGFSLIAMFLVRRNDADSEVCVGRRKLL